MADIGPLDQAGELSYRLTGSWDDPQVVREEGGLIPGGAPAAPPPSSTVPAAAAAVNP